MLFAGDSTPLFYYLVDSITKHVVQNTYFSRFSRKSEANASDFLKKHWKHVSTLVGNEQITVWTLP